MGRGGHDREQAQGAQQLLFGQRRPRRLTAAQRKKLQTERRRQERNLTVNRFIGQYDQLRADIARGQAGNLLDLPAAGHGLKGVEKQQLRAIIDDSSDLLDQAIDHRNSSVEMIEGIDGLAGLIALYDRAKEAGLPKSFSEQARYTALRYGHALANKKIVADLECDGEQIGSLPKTMLGQDYGVHLMIDGQALCDANIARHQMLGYRQSEGDSVITQTPNCHSCREHYQMGLSINRDHQACDLLSPEQWLSRCQECNLDYFGVYSEYDLPADAGGSAEERAEQVLALVSERNREYINRGLQDFTDYRLGS